MSVIIAGKLGFAAFGIAVASVGGVWLARLLNQETVDIYGFLEVVSSTSDVNASSGAQDPAPLTVKKDLECQIKGFKKFECSVGSVDKLTDGPKNHVSWEQLTATESVEAIKEKLDKTKFYKITIDESFFNTPIATNAQQQNQSTPTASWKSIEVFEKDDSKKLGSINALWQIKGSEKTSLGSWKTKYFVGQASSALKDSTDISGYKCSWDKNTTEMKDCTIMPFVANDAADGQSENSTISSLKFKQTNSWDSTIKQHHYYLIQFTDPSDQKDLERFDVEGAEIIYLKDGSDEKVKFQKLSAVKLIGEQLLILKKQTAA